jgi:hypothetical protein
MAGVPRLLIDRLGEDVYYRSLGLKGPSPSTMQRRARKENKEPCHDQAD